MLPGRLIDNAPAGFFWPAGNGYIMTAQIVIRSSAQLTYTGVRHDDISSPI
jgi:hypothetical protein